MKTSNILALGAAVSVLGLAAEANAAYVTYDFTGGSISGITALLNNTTPLLAGGTLTITGGDVVFDPTAATFQLQSFSFTATGSMALTGPLTGDTLAVPSVTVMPGGSYTVSSFTGTDPYHFLLTSIAASGNYSLTGPAAPAPKSGSFAESGGDNTSINTTLTLASSGGSEVLGLTGVTLGVFNVGSAANPRMITLKGNINFDAAPVPLPAALWLLASGLFGLLPFMRRVRAAGAHRGGALVGAFALILGVMAVPQASHASQVIAITPGSGTLLDVGSLCLTSSLLCNGPGTNATDVDLSTPYAGITGQFVYTPTSATAGTMSFMFTLAANATFGSGSSLQTLEAGSTFTATGINVSFSQAGSGKTLTDNIAEVGQATGSASISFASGLPVIAEVPTITNLNCSFTAKGGLCGVDLGGSSTPVSTGLQFGGTAGNPQYNGYLGFDAQVMPVPLPPSFWLMLGGLGCLGLMSRGRGAAVIARAIRR